MRRAWPIVVLLIGAIPGIAIAEVTDADAGGFALAHEAVIDADREAVWRAAIEVARWWSDDHTISGKAELLTINPVPRGCFCESLPKGGGVVHLMVTSVSPNSMLRLTGGLGPLGLMGVNGNMTWEFFDAENATRVRFAYAVGGYYPDGLDSIAGAVDFVIGEALQRLKAYVETGDANAASLE